MRTKTLLLSTLLTFAFASAANARVMVSGPLWSAGQAGAKCRALNASNDALQVTISVYSSGGTLLGSNIVNLNPMASAMVPVATVSAVSCRFAFDGSRRALRATASVHDGGSVVLDSQHAR